LKCDVPGESETAMMIDRPFIAKILCIGLVAAVMLPVGRMLFPYVSAELSRMQFDLIEAVASATIGFGIYGVFG
jgi:uncharacterized membrane protein